MLWLVALVPMLAGIVVCAAGLHQRAPLAIAACASLTLTFVLALLAANAGWTGGLEWSAVLTLQTALTPLSSVVAAMVPAVALPVLGFAAAHEHRLGLRRLIALLLFFVGAMELLVVAADFLTLLIGWELVGACSWALIGHDWRDADNPRSGLYAFLMTRFGDLGMFLAALAAFAGTGSFAYSELTRLDAPLLHLLVFGLVISAASKSGQVPFSPWLFRAMAGPTPVSALLHAATMVAAGAYLLARLSPLLDRVEWFAPVVIAIGLTTALAGGIVALLQNHAKKLLAASTSAQFGLVFVAVGAGYPAIAILHLVAHACFKALLFLSAGIAGARVNSFMFDAMRLGRALPIAAAMSAVGALALAGVPPLGGAWTKDAIVTAGGHSGLWLAMGVILAGGLSAAYATRFQLLAFGFAEDSPAGETPHWGELAALALLALASLALSLLWLPGVQRAIATMLNSTLLLGTATWEFVASVLTVAVGLVIGRFMVIRNVIAGADTKLSIIADWFALPALVDHAVITPSAALARMLARFDDAVIDALPRAIAAWSRGLSTALARGDGRVVDQGVRMTAAFVEQLSGAGNRFGELVVDGLPEGLARLTGLGGEDARKLQSGLSHQYFALLAIGVAVLFVTLILGS